MNSIFNEDGHLSQITYRRLKTGMLPEDELIAAASHMSDCEKCADAYACSFSTDELADAPVGFSNEVINKLYPHRVKKEGRRLFDLYSVKVAAAMCAALIMIITSVPNLIMDINKRIQDLSPPDLRPPDLSFVNNINTGLQNFTQKIFDWEGFLNEKETK